MAHDAAVNTPAHRIRMTAAHAAQRWWQSLELAERLSRLQLLRQNLFRRRDEIIQTLVRETGKTPVEALQSDIIATLEFLRYLEREAPSVLRERRAPTPMIFRGDASKILYKPLGVVLVIAPWNHPLQLALVPMASALAAGNAVILKHSERVPETTRVIADLCAQAGLGDAAQAVCGDGATAHALIETRPDMVFFTGGAAGGQAVLEATSRLMIPTILELGGKDPMIVFADADQNRAVEAAAYGAFSHAGQHCVSTRRLYVEATIHDSFVERLAARTRALAATAEWGRVMSPHAAVQARELVAETLAMGARLLAPESPENAGAEPTLVDGVRNEMRLMREETFAPVLGVARFGDEEEAVALANDSSFGLNASLWSNSEQRCEWMARRLETGNLYINDVLINIGNPYLPFGGVKRSGIGRYHGAEGLRAFCAPVSVMVSRRLPRMAPHWFPHDERKQKALEELAALRYGDLPWAQRVTRWLRLLGRM